MPGDITAAADVLGLFPPGSSVDPDGQLEVALYNQRFEATVVSRVGGGTAVELVGRHCESGDRLISGAILRDPRPGDLVAVAVTGAYCISLASNYNGAMRPPVVFCRGGESRAVVRRETLADLLSRDVSERP